MLASTDRYAFGLHVRGGRPDRCRARRESGHDAGRRRLPHGRWDRVHRGPSDGRADGRVQLRTDRRSMSRSARTFGSSTPPRTSTRSVAAATRGVAPTSWPQATNSPSGSMWPGPTRICCPLHPGMVGAVIVGEGGQAAAPVTEVGAEAAPTAADVAAPPTADAATPDRTGSAEIVPAALGGAAGGASIGLLVGAVVSKRRPSAASADPARGRALNG